MTPFDPLNEQQTIHWRTRGLEVYPLGRITWEVRRDFQERSEGLYRRQFPEGRRIVSKFLLLQRGSRVFGISTLSFCRSREEWDEKPGHGLTTFAISCIVPILEVVPPFTMKILFLAWITLAFVFHVSIISSNHEFTSLHCFLPSCSPF